MANAWKEVEWIASESLIHLEDALNIGRIATRDKTAEFNRTPDGYAKGGTVNIVTNPVYDAKEFATEIEIQEIRSTSRPLTIEKLFDVSATITAKERRLDFTDFSSQVIMPAAYAIAEKVEAYLGSKITNAAGMYASDDLFASAADMALAKKAATFQQVSPTGRFCLVNDTLEAKLLGAAYFNSSNSRGDAGSAVFTNGSMGHAMGMDFYSSLHLPESSAVAGTCVGQTNNASGVNNKVGSLTLTTDATTGTAKVGDHLKIAGVRRHLIVGVQANATATSITLRDPITDIIPDNAAITVVSSGNTNVFMGAIFDDSCLALASPILDPASDKPSFSVSNNGYSMRVVQGYDQKAKTETISIDMLCGAEVYDPRRVTALYEF